MILDQENQLPCREPRRVNPANEPGCWDDLLGFGSDIKQYLQMINRRAVLKIAAYLITTISLGLSLGLAVWATKVLVENWEPKAPLFHHRFDEPTFLCIKNLELVFWLQPLFGYIGFIAGIPG
eukprot:261533_1